MKGIPSLFYKKRKFEDGLAGDDLQYSSYYGDSFKRLKKNKPARVSLFILILLIICAILAPVIAPYDPNVQVLEDALKPASVKHLLGTDEYGRDILSRIIFGTRISLSVGLISQAIAIVIGVTLGSIAGFYGGKVDSIISRIMEMVAAFPDLLFAIAIMFVLGPGVINCFIALALLSWVGTARLIRGQVLQLKKKEYVEACIACGGKNSRIILKHLLPNCLSTIIVLVTLGIPGAIMSEASLSFLGLGVQTPTASWGSMISFAQPYIRSNPTYSIFPGIAIIITVLSFNIFGDGLRDALDPKLKN